ncbi:MAG TPA: NAD(P)(+) transhydrogenase (Re/Si-specific) subunit beta, partial [Hyphomicrobiaceae bacterium]
MSPNLIALLYLAAAVLFILALRGLSSPETSRRGNLLGMTGMAIAVATTLAQIGAPESPLTWVLIVGGLVIGGGIGATIARRIPMTSMPELVAAFHSLVGLAAVFVAAGALYAPEAFGIGHPGDIHGASLLEMSLGVAIGAVTFTGSVIAFAKLSGRMSGKPIILPARHLINIALAVLLVVLIWLFCQSGGTPALFWAITITALLFGGLIIVPIGGADMPVVISMLNSYSGWAAAGIGFTLGNVALIITGALVGSSGAILSYIMCKGMNRSFVSVILGGFGGETAGPAAGAEQKPVKLGSAEDAAFLLKNSAKVIIVPGYGMAVAQAQHALREMADQLKKAGVEVKYAIHPVAGRMPGHMNVLLAEANVPYDEVFELEDINNEFAQADVAYVIGANDVTNPAAEDDKSSPIYGMPVLQVWKAGTVMFNKRSLASGY